ncbi:MAG: sigma-70 family RNA polymerase sigma factor [Flammeovirgaceae bacterium]|nr:sigma-70 family RNA polymerase sigma factor [Flammeovirgaceae bacterium]
MKKNNSFGIDSVLSEDIPLFNKFIPTSEKEKVVISDKTLWRAFFEGKAEAINIIYQRNVDLLYNYGCHICNDPELVKDCIQDVFIQLIKYQSNITSVVSGKAYLIKALQREIFRKKKSLSKFPVLLGTQTEDFGLILSQETKIIEDQLTQERKSLIESALKKLTKKQREAISLYYLEGFTYEEIAYIMDLKLVKSARKIIYKAISLLKLSVSKKSRLNFMFSIIVLFI